jgi:hypothetical protein
LMEGPTATPSSRRRGSRTSGATDATGLPPSIATASTEPGPSVGRFFSPASEPPAARCVSVVLPFFLLSFPPPRVAVGAGHFRRFASSGSLAIWMAMRRASSRVSSFAAAPSDPARHSAMCECLPAVITGYAPLSGRRPGPARPANARSYDRVNGNTLQPTVGNREPRLFARRCGAVDLGMAYRRQVAMRCDGEDFVIALLPQEEVIFRTRDARALRNLCRRLRWQIAIDTTLSIDHGNGQRGTVSRPGC